MKTNKPSCELELAHNHSPIQNEPEPPLAAIGKQPCVRVPSSLTLVSMFFILTIALLILNKLVFTYIATNPTLLENFDRLTWQRTAFHFQPAKNFICDPNGMLFHMGWYPIFYQYNPYAPVWGNISWGHAVSKDMINWFELSVALAPSEWYDIEGVLSGSITVLPNGQIFALYTGRIKDFSQLQYKAVPANISDPLLVKWVKYDGNPILYTPSGIGLTDYRDPSTVWTGPDGKHRMIIGSRRRKTELVLIYHTTDYMNYVLLDEPLHLVINTGMWECVDFYPVSLTNDSALDMAAYGPGVKHVIKESRERHNEDWYSIGTYDAINDKWTPDNPDFGVGFGYRCDYGNFYASKSLYDHLKKRRVTWGFVRESNKRVDVISRGWAFTIGRTVVLDRKIGTNLLHWPIEEIESLRYKGKEFKKIKLEPGSIIPLDVGTTTQLDIVATFEVDQDFIKAAPKTNDKDGCHWGATKRGSLGPFGIVVLADETLSELTPVYFYMSKTFDEGVLTHFCSDKQRSTLDYDSENLVYGSDVPVINGEELTMRILVDHSIVEAFAQGGRTVVTSRVYPTKAIYDNAKLFLFNNATGMSVKATLKIWQMASAQVKPYPF
ncbi:beta-fructofuranosidase, soluble isoenzyme I-like [Bidens hawaiensis]|uniref:beta-fructofuranosidase, soluble isoenzyme I-like n=1 Tax=Bidens hawaiensis TaxID=980011 RepID=UPI00404A6078